MLSSFSFLSSRVGRIRLCLSCPPFVLPDLVLLVSVSPIARVCGVHCTVGGPLFVLISFALLLPVLLVCSELVLNIAIITSVRRAPKRVTPSKPPRVRVCRFANSAPQIPPRKLRPANADRKLRSANPTCKLSPANPAPQTPRKLRPANPAPQTPPRKLRPANPAPQTPPRKLGPANSAPQTRRRKLRPANSAPQTPPRKLRPANSARKLSPTNSASQIPPCKPSPANSAPQSPRMLEFGQFDFGQLEMVFALFLLSLFLVFFFCFVFLLFLLCSCSCSSLPSFCFCSVSVFVQKNLNPRPRTLLFFLLPPQFSFFFLSLGVLSLNFVVSLKTGTLKCARWGSLVVVPAAPPDRAAGARTRQPENSKRAHYTAPALHTHQNSTREPQERRKKENCGGKKKR